MKPFQVSYYCERRDPEFDAKMLFDEINKESVPYKWTYKMDTIDLSKEDIDSIVYEIVNAKAASAESKDKKAPKPISRKKKSIQN